jgi:hypothetical protein
MAQFPILRLTHAGHELSGMSQGGGKLIFVRAELGDGQIGEGESVENLTALKHQVMQLPLQGYLNEGNGKARLRFVVENSSLTAGFFNREIGIFAKMEGGEEQLYAYTNAGNYADYIPSKDTPIDGEIIDLHIIIGNASNVTIVTENSAYATQADLKEHNESSDAHADIRIAILQRNRAYKVGDIAYHKALPSWARLECVKAGATAATLPDKIEHATENGGVLITDGSVIWILDDLRDGTPVGAVRGSLYLPAGYIKCNGATVQRADYPRLVALADKHNLWTDDVTANAGLFGRGDGAATMVLPNWTDRMVQLAGDGAGATVAAGLPNVKISYRDRMYTGGESWSWQTGQEHKVLEDKRKQVTLAVEDGPYSYGSGDGSVYGGVVSIDVSKSNAIYGAVETVQPAAVKMLPIIRY